MRGGENSDSIPMDLVMEILSRLPTKSIARFCCVSKQWNSMLLSPYFTDLLLARSSGRPPRLLFACQRRDDWCFLTSPQPQDPYEKSSPLVVTADFQMEFPGKKSLEICGHASGFICYCQRIQISDKYDGLVYKICNPSTGQHTTLPLPKWRMKSTYWKSFFGYDPVDKQYKVFCINYSRLFSEEEETDQVLTLGIGNGSWRKIHCPFKHVPSDEGICINGVVYYFADGIDDLLSVIVCFDVRSEKFKFIDKDFRNSQNRIKVINYKGKLGVITLEDVRIRYRGGDGSTELCLWVVKDVENPKSEWSKYFSFRLDHQVIGHCYYPSIDGVTATGDIVLSVWDWDAPDSFYLVYLSPQSNTLQRVEIKGFGVKQFGGRVEVFLDHVEDLRFIMMKYAAKSSISPPKEERKPTSTSTISAKAHLQQDGRRAFKTINKFDSLCLLDDDECN